MITPSEVMIGVLAGFVLIAFGLVPGAFQGLAEGVSHSISSFSGSPGPPLGLDRFRQPKWLAGAGAALILVTMWAYLSQPT